MENDKIIEEQECIINMQNERTGQKQELVNKCKEEAANEDYEHEYRDLDRGWSWVVLIAAFFSFFLIGGSDYTVGIIHSTLLERYGANVGVTSWAGALHTALTVGGGPLSSIIVDRFSCRTAIMASGVCYIIGYLATAFAPNIEMAIFTCGIVAGCGGALGNTASVVVVGLNFRRYRNVALGFAIAGIGAGMFAMAPVLQMTREYYGSSGFFIFKAAIMANVVTLGALCFPNDMERGVKRRRQLDAKIVQQESTTCPVLRNYANIVLNRGVLCMCIGAFCYGFGTHMIYLYLPSYIVHKGFSAEQASYCIAISGVMTVVGRFSTGILANWRRLEGVTILTLTTGIVALATIFFPLYSGTYPGQIAFVVVLGLFFGSFFVLLTSINMKFVGLQYISAAIGVEYFFDGVGGTAGPVVAGIILDSGGTFEQAFIVAASCIMVTSVLCFVTRFFHKDRTDEWTESRDVPDVLIEKEHVIS